jgi:NitT/TauT family transport system substrate-binding protein
VRLRLLLNSGFSGPHAWFFLARERGYFSSAGLDLEFVAGDGAAAVVPLIGRDAIDAGYGDMNALAERVAREPQQAPRAVFAMFNRPPFTIAVRADSGLVRAGDLAGKTLTGHAQDAALLLFPALADAAGLAGDAVAIRPSGDSLGDQVRDQLLGGLVDGVFGFVNTILAAVEPLGVDPARLRFIEFADHLPDLYSNSLIVSRALLERAPEQVRGLVLALNRGLVDTLQNPDAGIEALARAAPQIDRAVQRRRLLRTLASEMAHAEGARLGIGDVDDARLARALALLSRVGRWPRTPAPEEVFTRAFLPPLQERVRTLAQ